MQGAAVVTMVLNIVALWKQEKMSPMTKDERSAPQPAFRTAWADLTRETDNVARSMVTIFLGTMAFNMQDVLLEPYGGEILGLSVSATTLLHGNVGLWCIAGLWSCCALVVAWDRPLPHWADAA